MERTIVATTKGITIIDELSDIDRRVLEVFNRKGGNVLASTRLNSLQDEAHELRKNGYLRGFDWNMYLELTELGKAYLSQFNELEGAAEPVVLDVRELEGILKQG